MLHPLEFSLAALVEKPTRFDGKVKPEAFEEPLSDQARLEGPVEVALGVSFKEDRVWLDGTASGRWQLQCCRCLTEVVQPFAIRLDVVVDEPPPTVDGLEEIRQTLLLNVPTKPYCREDCKGLCPQCGANRNVADCGHAVQLPSRFKITKRGKTDA